ncbi:hypothetical protein [Planococcus sp. SSTMD024]|uniref:hypothetical protein n=1 Tax=Planococcus sp. SSTMD024 TaxID=3242163 RepID=UPI00351ED57C
MGIQNLPQKSIYPFFRTLFLENAISEKGSSIHYTQNRAYWHVRAITAELSQNAEFSERTSVEKKYFFAAMPIVAAALETLAKKS